MPTRSGRTFRRRTSSPFRRDPTPVRDSSRSPSSNSSLSFAFSASSVSSVSTVSSVSVPYTSAMDDAEHTFNFERAAKFMVAFGGLDKDLLKFVEMAEVAYGKVTSDRDKEEFITLVHSKLEGPAFEFIRRGRYSEWEEIKNALRKKFLPRKTPAVIQSELARARQLGSVEKFGDYIRSLLSQLQSAIKLESGEALATAVEPLNLSMALSTFTSNLKPELGMIVRARNPADLDEALDIALAEEAIQEAARPTKPKAPQTVSAPPAPVASTFEKFKEQNSNPIKREMTCFFCKQVGHGIRECPDPKCKVSHPEGAGPSQPNGGGGAASKRVNAVRKSHRGPSAQEFQALRSDLEQLSQLFRSAQPSPLNPHANPFLGDTFPQQPPGQHPPGVLP
jgi:hypothetical protein